ncbi:hypothetical protein V1517DRAFT_352257 [Lipomyces orientalis]|uniref:Uncharacterized protein n=1 Tax=Lipomyces orientalis TaxID=1233043 RepID=A0ACC3TRC5_9ASCO
MAENSWRESTLGLSQEWSLNTTTVSAGVCGSPRSIESNSWFSIQVHPQKRTRPPCSRKNMRLSKMRARKIRLFPTTAQKETLRQWFGAQCYIYNKCVAVVRAGMKPTQKELRFVLLNSETNTLDDNEKWLDQYQYDLKDEAIRDFIRRIRSHLLLRLRSNKAPTQSLSRYFYSSIFSSSKMAAAEPLPTILARDSRLLRTQLGRYFLIVPNDGEEKRKCATRGDFVFIDPGVHTFLTCYDSNENVDEVGRCAVVRVSKLLHHRRKLQSRLATLLRRVYLRLGERINHLVEDMRKKTLNRKSKACMATLAHCAFFDRTAMKAEQFEQTQVVEVREEWTSKMCVCAGCTSVFDRDFNASKNIMLKYFTEPMMSSGSVSWDAATLGPSPAIQ